MKNVMKKARALHNADFTQMEERHKALLGRLKDRIAEYDRLGPVQAQERKRTDKQLNAWVDELIDLSPKIRAHDNEAELLVTGKGETDG